MPTAAEIIEALSLQPLPEEGGFYRRTWAAPSPDGRPAATTILYLMTSDSFSALHRLDATEIFHFSMGDACEQVVITPTGEMTTTVLGTDVLAGQQVQSIVPEECWQGTRLIEGGAWALVGATMSPGYRQAGFELASAADLRDFTIEVASVANRYLAEGA